MIVHLDDLARVAPEIAMRTCVELGHAMGNQHWPALVKGNLVYVPLTVDRKVMASVMDTHRFEGIRYEFVPGREVIPYLAPHESRRLFGGAEGPVHSHTHESYAAIDAETGRVYGRPPVRAIAPGPMSFHGSPAKPVSCTTMGNDSVEEPTSLHALRGCCSSATRCSPLAGSHFLRSGIRNPDRVSLPMPARSVRSRARRWSRQRAATVSR